MATYDGPHPTETYNTQIAGTLALMVSGPCGDDGTLQGTATATWQNGERQLADNGDRKEGYVKGVLTGGMVLSDSLNTLTSGTQLVWRGADWAPPPGAILAWGFCTTGGPCADGTFLQAPAPDFSFSIDAITDTTIAGSFNPTQFFYTSLVEVPPESVLTNATGSFTLTLEQ